MIATILIALSSFNYPNVTAKFLDRKMAQVEDHLYAAKFETTNAEYQQFLNHLKENSRNDEWIKYKIFSENWIEFYGEDGAIEGHYDVHPAYHEYPVVNITYEGAVKYCSWLTETYNSSPKRKFKRVIFRLPSEEEWVKAAIAGNDKSLYPQKSIYPWGTPFLVDENGVSNCNYLQINESNLKIDINNPKNISIIGKPIPPILTSPVDHYKPNKFGLYNMSGNAAEMLITKGRTKGGSWGSSGYYVRIDAEDEFKDFTSSPYVGFRYFMEIIEE